MRHRVFLMGICSGIVLLLTSCASYSASALGNFPTALVRSSKENGINVVAKAFNVADCKKYLDRDLLAVGYQPVQLFIQNNSDKSLIFSMDSFSLPYGKVNEVAERVHTSTLGRAVGYGIGALFLWPLAIPAVVDGMMSYQANEALDRDFAGKIAENQIIFPHSHFNKIVFVPIHDYQPGFSVTLLDVETGKPQMVKVVAN